MADLNFIDHMVRFYIRVLKWAGLGRLRDPTSMSSSSRTVDFLYRTPPSPIPHVSFFLRRPPPLLPRWVRPRPATRDRGGAPVASLPRHRATPSPSSMSSTMNPPKPLKSLTSTIGAAATARTLPGSTTTSFSTLLPPPPPTHTTESELPIRGIRREGGHAILSPRVSSCRRVSVLKYKTWKGGELQNLLYVTLIRYNPSHPSLWIWLWPWGF
jgi:hypothetical protein